MASFYSSSSFSHHFTWNIVGMISEEGDLITDFLYMPKYRYIVMCTQRGKLNVYKWLSTPDLLIEFKHMVNKKPIKGLMRHPDRVNQFISVCLDHTIRVWCLEKLTC